MRVTLKVGVQSIYQTRPIVFFFLGHEPFSGCFNNGLMIDTMYATRRGVELNDFETAC